MAKNKMKSHRGACKRLKLTGSGKIKRNRGLRKATLASSADLKRMLRSMAK